MTPTPQQRTRALMLATALSFVAYVAPLPFSPVAVYSVFMLLLPPVAAWAALAGGLPLTRRGLALPAALMLPPLLVGLAAGLVLAATIPQAGYGMVPWGAGSGLAAGIGAWLVLRRVG